jgi:hypothetical protein
MALLVGAAAVAQQARSNTAAAYVPLVEGTAWHYRTFTSHADLPPTESRYAVGVLGSYLDGTDQHFLVRLMHGSTTEAYEHWQLHRDGLLTWRCGGLAIGAADISVAPERPLAAPVGAVNEWKYHTRVAPVRDREEPEPWVWTARIVAYEEPVAVPAGAWPAVHVVANGSRRDETSCMEAWYVRGIGLVRSDTRTGTMHERRELLRFEPGVDATPLRLALLQVQLPVDWLWSQHGPARIEWLDQGIESLCLPGRFALLDAGGARRCAFVALDQVVPLDVADASAWQGLLTRTARQGDPPTTATFGRLLARTLAHSQGLRIAAIDSRIRADDDGPLERSSGGASIEEAAGCWLRTIDGRGNAREARVALDGERLRLRFE